MMQTLIPIKRRFDEATTMHILNKDFQTPIEIFRSSSHLRIPIAPSAAQLSSTQDEGLPSSLSIVPSVAQQILKEDKGLPQLLLIAL